MNLLSKIFSLIKLIYYMKYQNLLIFLLICSSCLAYELLDDVPVTFQIAGNVTYTPSSGGVNIPGYILKIGYFKNSWIGIKFMALTSRSTYDVVVISRDSTSTSGFYKIRVKQYFMSSARQDKLISDSNNNMDKQVQKYTNNNYFQVQVYRTKGNTLGQDWEGGEMLSVCFYTSQNQFSESVWSGLKQSCYTYDISSDYISTYRGKFIKQTTINGVSSSIYGGIEGPLLKTILFWYVPLSSLSSSQIFIRVGKKISDDLGYDFYKCGPGSGDYFGSDTNSLTADKQWSGFNDGSCIISSSATGTKIAYTKNVYTNDQFDYIIYETNQVCFIVGGQNACQQLKLQLLFPIIDVESALVVWEKKQIAQLLLVMILVLFCSYF